MRPAAVPLAFAIAACSAPATRRLPIATQLTPVIEAVRAEQIIVAMRAAYREAAAYKDTGTITVLTVTAKVVRFKTTMFQTAFARAERFRYEQSDENGSCVAWSDHDSAYSQCEGDPAIVVEGPLPLALQRVDRAIFDLAQIVPALLHEDEAEPAHDWTTFQIAGEETIGDRLCWRLEDPSVNATVDRMWIDQVTHLIVRLETNRPMLRFATTFEPHLAVPTELELAVPDPAALGSTPRHPGRQDLGVIFEPGTRRVRFITPGSIAARIGFEIGDEIVSSTGAKVFELEDDARIFVPAHPKKPVTFEVKRADKTLRLEIAANR
jgi:hypothetical protein